MKITVAQALGWKKDLQQRHTELVALRNENSKKSDRLFGEEKTIHTDPVYDIKKLDKLVNQVAREVRKLDDCIKAHNGQAILESYDKDDTILGEVE